MVVLKPHDAAVINVVNHGIFIVFGFFMRVGTTQSHRCGAVTTGVGGKADKTHQLVSRREISRQ